MSKPKTLFDKIWADHEVSDGLIYIDLHLVHEVTSPQAFEGLRLAGRPVRRPDRTVATADHNVPTDGTPVAARIKARHATLTELFGLMRLAPETIEQEVEDIEHHLRPQTLAALGKLVSYWKAHPEHLQSFLRFSRKK